MKESNKYGTIIYLLIKNVEMRWNSERNVYQIIYMYIICNIYYNNNNIYIYYNNIYIYYNNNNNIIIIIIIK